MSILTKKKNGINHKAKNISIPRNKQNKNKTNTRKNVGKSRKKLRGNDIEGGGLFKSLFKGKSKGSKGQSVSGAPNLVKVTTARAPEIVKVTTASAPKIEKVINVSSTKRPPIQTPSIQISIDNYLKRKKQTQKQKKILYGNMTPEKRLWMEKKQRRELEQIIEDSDMREEMRQMYPQQKQIADEIRSTGSLVIPKQDPNTQNIRQQIPLINFLTQEKTYNHMINNANSFALKKAKKRAAQIIIEEKRSETITPEELANLERQLFTNERRKARNTIAKLWGVQDIPTQLAGLKRQKQYLQEQQTELRKHKNIRDEYLDFKLENSMISQNEKNNQKLKYLSELKILSNKINEIEKSKTKINREINGILTNIDIETSDSIMKKELPAVVKLSTPSESSTDPKYVNLPLKPSVAKESEYAELGFVKPVNLPLKDTKITQLTENINYLVGKRKLETEFTKRNMLNTKIENLESQLALLKTTNNKGYMIMSPHTESIYATLPSANNQSEAKIQKIQKIQDIEKKINELELTEIESPYHSFYITSEMNKLKEQLAQLKTQ